MSPRRVNPQHSVDGESRTWSGCKTINNSLHFVWHEHIVRIQQTDDVSIAFVKGCI
jgi:hypothetical protein